ncbi:Conserved_hypothetical protein [Hexamita inflata]|uniref:Myb-like DNA-binding domain-containing protein n=1 Tax=Hexamita inflata TaxID=28002 RepID=A0AA86UIK4_9EUKA|nr:Conserved hypothetical protein [Hexamita inflata]
MQTTHTKAFAPKTMWSNEEVKIFFALLPKFGSSFKQYMPHLNRTYSQIKGFYHNHIRRHATSNEIDSLENSFKVPVQNTYLRQSSQETVHEHRASPLIVIRLVMLKIIIIFKCVKHQT